MCFDQCVPVATDATSTRQKPTRQNSTRQKPIRQKLQKRQFVKSQPVKNQTSQMVNWSNSQILQTDFFLGLAEMFLVSFLESDFLVKLFSSRVT